MSRRKRKKAYARFRADHYSKPSMFAGAHDRWKYVMTYGHEAEAAWYAAEGKILVQMDYYGQLYCDEPGYDFGASIAKWREWMARSAVHVHGPIEIDDTDVKLYGDPR